MALNDPCPAGLFEEFEVPRTLLPALPGEPVVLGLAEHWTEPDAEALRALQAELDQLGVSLLLISSRELLCMRPGQRSDAVVRSSRMRQLWPSGLGPWHRAPAVNANEGPSPANTRRSVLTLALVDEHGIVRWLQRSPQSEATLTLLHEALEEARQRLQRQQRLASGERAGAASLRARAELTASLAAALTDTFGVAEAANVTSRAAANGDARSWPRHEAARSFR